MAISDLNCSSAIDQHLDFSIPRPSPSTPLGLMALDSSGDGPRPTEQTVHCTFYHAARPTRPKNPRAIVVHCAFYPDALPSNFLRSWTKTHTADQWPCITYSILQCNCSRPHKLAPLSFLWGGPLTCRPSQYKQRCQTAPTTTNQWPGFSWW